jgi:hypothetical protein
MYQWTKRLYNELRIIFHVDGVHYSVYIHLFYAYLMKY